MGGVELNNSTPSLEKTEREYNFDIINTLCNRFVGLSPFEVRNTNLSDVLDLYVDCVIHDYKEKNGNDNGDIWVTSNTATWH